MAARPRPRRPRPEPMLAPQASSTSPTSRRKPVAAIPARPAFAITAAGTALAAGPTTGADSAQARRVPLRHQPPLREFSSAPREPRAASRAQHRRAFRPPSSPGSTRVATVVRRVQSLVIARRPHGVAARRPARAHHGRALLPSAHVRAVAGSFARLSAARRRLHSAQQRRPARDQSPVHRSLHGRPEPRNGPPAFVERLPNRSARQLFPPVLGCLRLCAAAHRSHRPRAARRRAEGHSAHTHLASALRRLASIPTAPISSPTTWC